MISNSRREMSSNSDFVSILDKRGKAGAEAKAAWESIRLMYPEFPLPHLTDENRKITLDWSYSEGYFSIGVIEFINSFGSDVRVHWKGVNKADNQQASCELLNLNGAIHMWKPWLDLILESYNKESVKQIQPEPDVAPEPVNHLLPYLSYSNEFFIAMNLKHICASKYSREDLYLYKRFNKIINDFIEKSSMTTEEKKDVNNLNVMNHDSTSLQTFINSIYEFINKKIDSKFDNELFDILDTIKLKISANSDAKSDLESKAEPKEPTHAAEKEAFAEVLEELGSNQPKVEDTRDLLAEYRSKLRHNMLNAIELKLTIEAKSDEGKDPTQSSEVTKYLESLQYETDDVIKKKYNELYPLPSASTDKRKNKFIHTNSSLNFLKAIAPGMHLVANGMLKYVNDTYTDEFYANIKMSFIDDIRSQLNDMSIKFSEKNISKEELCFKIENELHFALDNFGIYNAILEDKALKESLQKSKNEKQDKELADFNKKNLDKMIREGRAKPDFESDFEDEYEDMFINSDVEATETPKRVRAFNRVKS